MMGGTLQVKTHKKPKSFINNALHTLQFKGRINIKFVKECVNSFYVFVTSYKTSYGRGNDASKSAFRFKMQLAYCSGALLF